MSTIHSETIVLVAMMNEYFLNSLCKTLKLIVTNFSLCASLGKVKNKGKHCY